MGRLMMRPSMVVVVVVVMVAVVSEKGLGRGSGFAMEEPEANRAALASFPIERGLEKSQCNHHYSHHRLIIY